MGPACSRLFECLDLGRLDLHQALITFLFFRAQKCGFSQVMSSHVMSWGGKKDGLQWYKPLDPFFKGRDLLGLDIISGWPGWDSRSS